MTRFKILSIGKKSLAIALCIMLVAMSLPVSGVLAATGDTITTTFTFSEEGLDGASVEATRTDNAGSTSGTIADREVELNVVEGGAYDLSIMIHGVEVATSSIHVPTDDGSPIPVTLTVLPPTVSVSSDPIEFGSVSAIFTANAVGLGELSYQWYESSIAPGNECGTDSATFIMTDTTKLTTLNAGTEYFCVVSSALAAGDNSSSAVLTVEKKIPSVNMAATPVDSKDTELTATVFGVTLGGLHFVPTGSIEFYDGSTLLDTIPVAPAAALNASASLPVKDLDPLNHTLKAVFIADGGDAYFADSVPYELSYNVADADQQTGFEFAAASDTKTYYRGYTYTQAVTDPKAANGNTVTYSIAPATAGVSVDASGVVSITETGKVGTYTITATKPAGNGYAVATTTYTLIVEKATPVIQTAPHRPAITYGQTFGNAAFTGYVLQDPTTSDTVSGSVTFNSAITGNKPTVTDSDADTLYGIVFTPTLIDLYKTVDDTSPITVNKAKLTVIANSPTITYNDEIPLDVVVMGFVNDETEASLASAGYIRPTAACSVSNRATSGTYDDVIIPEGGTPTANYYFDYVSGTLTINSAPIVKEIDYSVTTPTNGVNGWFNKADIDGGNKFKIEPKAGSENGYDQMSTSPSGPWKSSLEYDSEISEESITFYLRNSDPSSLAVSQSNQESYKIDTTAPTAPLISYNKAFLDTVIEIITFGFYQAPVTVTVTATDDISGVQFIDWSYKGTKGQYDTTKVDVKADDTQRQASHDGSTNTYKVTFTIEETDEFKGIVSAIATDYAGNKSSEVDTAQDSAGKDSGGIVVDNTKPEIVQVSYGPEPSNPGVSESYIYKNSTVTITDTDYYKENITVTVKIDEANFYADDVNIDITATDIDGNLILTTEMAGIKEALKSESEWTHDGTVHTASFTLAKDAYYNFTVNYTDKSKNKMEEYKSRRICLDKTMPTVSVTYDNNIQQTVGDRDYFNANLTATVAVTEHNFMAEGVDIKVTATDITGADVTAADVANKYNAYAKNPANWTRNGDVYTLTLQYDVDANYTFAIQVDDLAGNQMHTYQPEEFTVDKVAPTDPVISYDKPFFETVVEVITFGFYRAPVTVTVTATDDTSGVQFIDWSYKGTKGQYDTTKVDVKADDTQRQASHDGSTNTYKVSFEIEAEDEFKGIVSAIATDYANNSLEVNTAQDSAGTDSGGIVVDNTKPEIVQVSYEPKSSNPGVSESYIYKNSTVTITDTDYYKEDITVTVKIDEANFYAEDVNIDITATDIDGNLILTTEMAAIKEALKSESEWTHDGTVHTASFTLAKDAYYNFTVNYTDKSNNNMEEYISRKLCLDKTIPTALVTYDNNNIQQTVGDRDYFNANRTATVAVTEHNFMPEGVDIEVTATDITGADVTAADVVNKYNAYAKNPANWTRNGDVYTLTLQYDVDANYTFAINKVEDLAGNCMDSYPQEEFTVDKVAPTDPVISYDKPFFETVVEVITFGFYRAPVTVTVTATDDTSGVQFIDWSYKGTKGQYDTTKVDVRADDTQRQASHDGSTNTYKVSFEIEAEDEFKGIVSAIATDYAGNESSEVDTAQDSAGKDSGGVVVDNTKPEIEVLYSPTGPAQTIDETDFYNNNITVTFKITEANFYAEDVNVNVIPKNKDGSEISSIDVDAMKEMLQQESTWTHDKTVHTATLTLTADAYYNFTVNYTDKSKNKMEEYKSRRICLDKTAPNKLEIQYNTNPFRDFLNLITFNLFPNKVDVTIKAFDEMAGIQSIEWQYVGSSGLDNSAAVNVSSDLQQKTATRKTGTHEYTVSFSIAEQFKGEIKAAAIDFATNRSGQDPAIDAIEIVDTKDPIIEVTYPGDVAPSVSNSVDYYKADRTVRVEITEDNFVDATTQIIITRDGQPYSAIIPASWTSNGTSHVKQFAFNEDGDYTLEVYCKDIVGREAKVIEKAFTLDKTLPVIGVAYNNNDVRNGNYYNAERTATITVTEHNFNAADVNLSVVATDDGATIAAPHVGAWSANGDVHTATIHYSADARYSFSIAYTDLAGNAAAPFAPEEFYVDKTAPEIIIENVSDSTAYGDSIQPTIKLSDINYGGDYTVTLRRTDVNASSADIYAKLDKTVVNNANGQGVTISFANIPTELKNDGIYNLTVTLKDKAEHETIEIRTFSVNRFGSTYYFADDATRALADKTEGTHFTNAEINIKIGEINVEPLADNMVTVSRNNDVVNELKYGDDYTISDASRAGQWYTGVYDIKAKNFSSEGFYTVIVTSTDTAKHTSKNTVPVAKGNELPVEFTVDKTLPELTVKNIESRRAYSDAERKITIESTDINLDCESLKVSLDGSEVEIDQAKLTPDQFGKLSVEITVKANKGQAQDLDVKISDYANNEQTATVTRFTLSANIFQLWYQNTLLFVLSLVGIAALSGGLFFLLWKHRKKNKAEAHSSSVK